MKEYNLDRKWPALFWGAFVLAALSGGALSAGHQALGAIGVVLGAAGVVAALARIRCSACGKSLDRLGLRLSQATFFCPRCGAKINRV